MRPFTRISRVFLILSAGVLTPTQTLAFDRNYKETINGTTLHFRVRGADAANSYLLILHGGPGFSSHMFYPWGPSLEQKLNLVYLDQRGCGESARYHLSDPFHPKPEEVRDFTVATLMRDIEEVRTFLKIERWYVLGHSWGGMLGLEYVVAHPDKVLGYIHMDGLLSVPMTEEAILTGAEAKFRAEPKKAESDEGLKTIKQLRALPSTDPQRLVGAFELAMGPAELYFVKDQPTAFAAFNRKIFEAVSKYNLPPTALMPAIEPGMALIVRDRFLTYDARPLLAKVKVPTLILNGKQDGVVPAPMAEVAHAGIAGSRLVILNDCGHFPFAEQPQKTADSILDFVRAQSTR